MPAYTPKGDPVDRAFSAYFRRFGASANQPASSSRVERDDKGLDYVVLRNTNGVLAVYRIRPSGELKLLTRWPAELAER